MQSPSSDSPNGSGGYRMTTVVFVNVKLNTC